jgi:hypothetical protein
MDAISGTLSAHHNEMGILRMLQLFQEVATRFRAARGDQPHFAIMAYFQSISDCLRARRRLSAGGTCQQVRIGSAAADRHGLDMEIRRCETVNSGNLLKTFEQVKSVGGFCGQPCLSMKYSVASSLPEGVYNRSENKNMLGFGRACSDGTVKQQ